MLNDRVRKRDLNGVKVCNDDTSKHLASALFEKYKKCFACLYAVSVKIFDLTQILAQYNDYMGTADRSAGTHKN